MKANELRIGNWFHADTQLQPNYLQIKARDILELSIDPQDDYYKPIPLTEEWLVRFGFLKTGLMNNKPLYEFGYYEFSDGTLLDGVTGIAQCVYVHQLQNLYFALTGEELEIKE